MQCVFCNRRFHKLTKHHLIPECRGGGETIDICSDCHRAVHQFFTNKQLEKDFNTVESLLSSEGFRKHINFLSKQPPETKFKTILPSHQKRRGRNA